MKKRERNRNGGRKREKRKEFDVSLRYRRKHLTKADIA